MTRLFTTDSPSFDEIMRKKKPIERSVDICIDPTLIRQWQDLNNDANRIKGMAKAAKDGSLADTSLREIEAIEAQMRELEQPILDATVKFIARDPGRRRFEQLQTEHRPTEEQKKEWKDSGEFQRQGQLSWNPDTFPPALMALCYIQPEMTVQQADRLCEEWGVGEVSKLFNNALQACNEVSAVPKFRSGTDPTSSTALNSTTALNGESPTPNS